jgi:Holliday junction resolvase RusA-like endonuclease
MMAVREPVLILEVTLPGEPQGKPRPRFNSRTRTAFLPSEYRKYEKALALAARVAAKRPAPATEDVRVEVDVYHDVQGHERHRPDLDNCVKAALDSIRGVAYADDRQVTEIVATRREVDGVIYLPCLIVKVYVESAGDSPATKTP